MSHLYGPAEARRAFERLAGEAWVALPGSPDGKAQAYPQERPLEKWLQFVYDRLLHHPGSYLDMHDDHWVAFKTGRGPWQERHCPPTLERREYPDGRVMMETVHPDAVGLTGEVRRWRMWSLATDPFIAAAAAIDVWLDHSRREGRYLISSQELDAHQNSPEFQKANVALDIIGLGEGREFPIMRDWCKVVPGSHPTLCPIADPPVDEKDREALRRYLPRIEALYRGAGLLGEGQTIHWVGRQAKLGTVCACQSPGQHPDGPEGGCWLWWRNARHDIPKGVVYRLLEYMWDRDSASYDKLDKDVFEAGVLPGTIRARANDVNGVLKKLGIPW